MLGLIMSYIATIQIDFQSEFKRLLVVFPDLFQHVVSALNYLVLALGKPFNQVLVNQPQSRQTFFLSRL